MLEEDDELKVIVHDPQKKGTNMHRQLIELAKERYGKLDVKVIVDAQTPAEVQRSKRATRKAKDPVKGTANQRFMTWYAMCPPGRSLTTRQLLQEAKLSANDLKNLSKKDSNGKYYDPVAGPLLATIIKMGNELDGVVPQSQLKQRVRGQNQFKGDEGLVNFREGLQELENAGYIRKIPESHRAGPGRRSDGSWEVRDILLKKPVSKPTDAKAEPTVGLNLTPTIEPGIPTEPLTFEMQPNWADTELPF